MTLLRPTIFQLNDLKNITVLYTKMAYVEIFGFGYVNLTHDRARYTSDIISTWEPCFF